MATGAETASGRRAPTTRGPGVRSAAGTDVIAGRFTCFWGRVRARRRAGVSSGLAGPGAAVWGVFVLCGVGAVRCPVRCGEGPADTACGTAESDEGMRVMTGFEAERPDDEEIALLLREVERVYREGAGPARGMADGGSVGGGGEGVRLWHGEVLADLVDPVNDDPGVFAAVARGHGLDSAAGLQDLVRVSAAEAAVGALRFVLGWEDPFTGERVHGGAVLDEILMRQSWLSGPSGS